MVFLLLFHSGCFCFSCLIALPQITSKVLNKSSKKLASLSCSWS
jgi:hypothetical protein